MAGVSAARGLSEKGYLATLIEVHDRLQGRTYTGSALGGQLELGGAYVHWRQLNA